MPTRLDGQEVPDPRQHRRAILAREWLSIGAAGVTLPVLAAMLIGACVAPPPPEQNALSTRELRVPAAEYFGVEWFADNRLFLGWRDQLTPGEPDNPNTTAHIVSLGLDDEAHVVMPKLPMEPTCTTLVDDFIEGRLPDGRLGYLRSCREPFDFRVMALDVASGEHELLAALGDPVTDDGHMNVYHYSFRRDMRGGVIEVGSRICDGLALFDAKGLRPFEPAVRIGDATIDLASFFRRPCPEVPNARLPRFSPDGERIAFVASPATVGKDGFARLDQPYDLLVMDPDSGKAEVLMSGIRAPFGLEWSPNGDWLIVLEDVALSDSRLWLVSAEGGKAQRLAVDRATQAAAWSPDGRQLATLVRVGNIDDLEMLTKPVIVNVETVVAGERP